MCVFRARVRLEKHIRSDVMIQDKCNVNAFPKFKQYARYVTKRSLVVVCRFACASE